MWKTSHESHYPAEIFMQVQDVLIVAASSTQGQMERTELQ
jgi:hypothetical protein